MSASDLRTSVLDYDAGGPQHLCLSDFESSRDPRLFVYSFKVMPGKRQALFFPIYHSQPTVERIATKASDVYCQLQLRWPSSLCFLEE